jgi:protein involved in ribonucleotide reduction
MKKDVLFNIDNNVYGGGNFIVNTVPKQGLYDGYVPAVTPVANLGHANCFAAKGGDPAPNAFFMTSDVDKTNGKNTAVAGTPNFTENYCIDTTDNRIQLFGEVTIKLNANAAPFSYKMAALDDSNGVGVIENPYFDVVAENDVPLGVRMGALVAGVATDNINLIEAAISVDGSTFVGTYDSLTSMVGGDANAPTGVAESLSVVTLPTKYRHVTDSTPDINHVTDDATKKDTYYETSPFTNVPFVTRHASTMGLLADFDGVPAAGALQIVTNAKEFDDNGRSEDGSSRDVLKYESTYVHYDYDYGFKEALMVAIDGFAPGGAAPRPNHWPAPASDFIYGQYNDACTSVVASGKTANRPFNSTYGNTLPATYTRTTYDLEENRYTVAATQNTGVISGGIGDGTTVSNAFLPQEVNILTDDDMSWYSTKGWYQLSVNGTCHVDNGVGVGGVANDQVVNGTESEYSVPAFILTVTTDGQGNSRVVPATRFAD